MFWTTRNTMSVVVSKQLKCLSLYSNEPDTILSGFTAQIRPRKSKSSPMTWSSLALSFQRVVFFSNTISNSYQSNNEHIPYFVLHVLHMHIRLAATNEVELGSNNITWNLLEPSIDGNTFNLAAALSDSKSFSSISFTMYCRCSVLWRVSSRYSTIFLTLKNSPVAIVLCKVVLAKPPTWLTSPFPCSAILKIRLTFTWNLFASVCLPWKWADDLYC